MTEFEEWELARRGKLATVLGIPRLAKVYSLLDTLERIEVDRHIEQLERQVDNGEA